MRKIYLSKCSCVTLGLIFTVLLLAFSSHSDVKAQSYSFDDFNDNSGCPVLNEVACPFGEGNCDTEGWSLSHGSPDLKQISGDPVNSTICAFIGNTDFPYLKNEGIFKSFSFESGKTYRISYQIKTKWLQGGVAVRATNDIVAGSCGNTSYSIPTSQSQQLIENSTLFRDTTWQTFSVDFTPGSNFSQIWIRPYGGSDNGSVYIDNISISECSIVTPSSITGPNNDLCKGTVETYRTTSIPATSSYTWQVLSGSTVLWTRTTTPNYVNIDAVYFNPGSYTLRVRRTNACGGNSSWKSNYFAVRSTSDPKCGSCGGRVCATVYPNPTSEYLDVSLDESDNATPTEILVYDDKNQMVKNTKSAESFQRIDIKDLPGGSYFVHIKQGEKVSKKKVLVKH